MGYNPKNQTMKTAEEFFREKLKAKRPDRDITLAFTSIRAEEGMIWANEFASEQNAQLRKEIEELEKTSNITIALLEEEKDKLRKENEELKVEKEQRTAELTAVGMGKQQEIDAAKQFIKNLQSRINELQRCLGWSDMEPHHPIGSRLGYGEINTTPDWDALSKIEPPTDNHLDNKAWRGAWLEGQMVGYAKCQKKITRLTELLRRAEGVINKYANTFFNQEAKDIVTEIENAIEPS